MIPVRTNVVKMGRPHSMPTVPQEIAIVLILPPAAVVSSTPLLTASRILPAQARKSMCFFICAFSLPVLPLHSRDLMQSSTFFMSAVGSKRATTLPLRSMMNFVKFHLMSGFLSHSGSALANMSSSNFLY